jgi:hypothetical protein
MSRNPDKTGELVAVSITSRDWQAQPGQLGTFDLSKMRNEAIEAIEHTKQVYWAVLGLDISLNDDTAKGFDLTWQAQFYGFARVSDRIAFSKSLRRHFIEMSVSPGRWSSSPVMAQRRHFPMP